MGPVKELSILLNFTQRITQVWTSLMQLNQFVNKQIRFKARSDLHKMYAFTQ